MNRILRIICSTSMMITFITLTLGMVIGFAYYNYQLIVASVLNGYLIFKPILVVDLFLMVTIGNLLQMSRDY